MVFPDKIIIHLVSENSKPFSQSNILIELKTFANHKKDILLYPFASNEEGVIIINQQDLKDKELDFISYGLMDHTSIEDAKNNVEIFLMTERAIGEQLSRIDRMKENGKRILTEDVMNANQRREFADSFQEIEIKLEKECSIYSMAKNNFLNTELSTPIIDKWDGRQQVYEYSMVVHKKSV